MVPRDVSEFILFLFLERHCAESGKVIGNKDSIRGSPVRVAPGLSQTRARVESANPKTAVTQSKMEAAVRLCKHAPLLD
jgi:hypothetical protein